MNDFDAIMRLFIFYNIYIIVLVNAVMYSFCNYTKLLCISCYMQKRISISCKCNPRETNRRNWRYCTSCIHCLNSYSREENKMKKRWAKKHLILHSLKQGILFNVWCTFRKNKSLFCLEENLCKQTGYLIGKNISWLDNTLTLYWAQFKVYQLETCWN